VAINEISIVPLERERRASLPTADAAYHLNRAQQTLRLWAMRENGVKRHQNLTPWRHSKLTPRFLS
jgi:hypothetical protein